MKTRTSLDFDKLDFSLIEEYENELEEIYSDSNREERDGLHYCDIEL